MIAAGWRILPVTQEDLREGRARFVATLREALAAAPVVVQEAVPAAASP